MKTQEKREIDNHDKVQSSILQDVSKQESVSPKLGESAI
jgi:hypothetical protein